MTPNREPVTAANGDIFILESGVTVGVAPRHIPEQAQRAAEIAAFPALISSLAKLRELFDESHAIEIQNNHFGDNSCSYCEALDAADELLNKFQGEIS